MLLMLLLHVVAADLYALQKELQNDESNCVPQPSQTFLNRHPRILTDNGGQSKSGFAATWLENESAGLGAWTYARCLFTATIDQWNLRNESTKNRNGNRFCRVSLDANLFHCNTLVRRVASCYSKYFTCNARWDWSDRHRAAVLFLCWIWSTFNASTWSMSLQWHSMEYYYSLWLNHFGSCFESENIGLETMLS